MLSAGGPSTGRKLRRFPVFAMGDGGARKPADEGVVGVAIFSLSVEALRNKLDVAKEERDWEPVADDALFGSDGGRATSTCGGVSCLGVIETEVIAGLPRLEPEAPDDVDGRVDDGTDADPVAASIGLSFPIDIFFKKPHFRPDFSFSLRGLSEHALLATPLMLPLVCLCKWAWV